MYNDYNPTNDISCNISSSVSGFTHNGIDASSVSLYPNPSDNTIQFSYKLDKQNDVSIELLNNLGRLVDRIKENNMGTGTHFATLDTHDFPVGVYCYRFSTGKGAVSGKFVVSH